MFLKYQGKVFCARVLMKTLCRHSTKYLQFSLSAQTPGRLEVMQLLKYARRLIQALALLIFAYQMMNATEKYVQFRSSPTGETRNIGVSSLPDFYICNGDFLLLNHVGENKTGYSFTGFLKGSINKALNYVSWEGAENLTYENVSRQLFFTIGDEMGVFSDSYKEGWTLAGNLPEVFKAFTGFCRKLQTSKIDLRKTFRIKMYSRNSFQVIVTNPERSLHYMFDPTTLQGDQIQSYLTHKSYYSIELEEILWNEESGECSNYGVGKPFLSYADCIANEQEKVLKPLLGCMVPWLVGVNHSNNCKGRIQLGPEKQSQYHKAIRNIYRTRYFKIIEESQSCLKTCAEIQAKSTMTKQKDIKLDDYLAVVIHIKKSVKVTKYIKVYGIFDLVVEVGSSLGLWIGLSALGVFDLLLEAMAVIKHKLCRLL